jgi:hypothetical protein
MSLSEPNTKYNLTLQGGFTFQLNVDAGILHQLRPGSAFLAEAVSTPQGVTVQAGPMAMGIVTEPYAVLLNELPNGIYTSLEVQMDRTCANVKVKFLTDCELSPLLTDNETADILEEGARNKQKLLNAYLALHFKATGDPIDIGSLYDFEKVTDFFGSWPRTKCHLI